MNLKFEDAHRPSPSPPKGRRGRLFTSPSPFNGERAGVRGENVPARSLSPRTAKLRTANFECRTPLHFAIRNSQLDIPRGPKGRFFLSPGRRPGYGCDGMSAACRVLPEPVEGPRFPFNSSCISPALRAGGIFVCPFPRAKASRAFGAGAWPRYTPKSKVPPTFYIQFVIRHSPIVIRQSPIANRQSKIG